MATPLSFGREKTRILGWVEEASGYAGYVVITDITGNQVTYLTSDGRVGQQGADPGHFINFPIAQYNLRFDNNSIGTDQAPFSTIPTE